MNDANLFPGFAPALLALFGVGSLFAQGGAVIERNVAVKMRDGVVLRADVYRPEAPGKYPVILQRTPYGKVVPTSFGLKAAAEGYVAIVQDCRGRYASDGDWDPIFHEFDDGYDTVEWAAALPYVNGKVGVYGGSYGGYTTLMAALSHPPHLAGFVSIEAGDSFYEGFIYRGGALQKWLAETWTSNSLALDTLERLTRKKMALEEWTHSRPAAGFPVLAPAPPASAAPYFFEWLRHPSYDEYWKRASFDDRYAGVTAPGVHVGGWYDVFAAGPPRTFNGMRRGAATAQARNGQRLILGPWSHGPLLSKAGDLDFGPEAQFKIDEFGFRWFDYLLRGNRNGLERQKAVRIFVMGANVWRDEDEWPLARARETRYYLGSSGKANGSSGSGSLVTARPQAHGFDEYVYDPANPVPTTGGGLCCGRGSVRAGALDQQAVEKRSDVLVYTTPPFEKDVEVTGPVRAELFISSSAVDTDFTATLVDVWPNGFSQNLTDGVERARYRVSTERATFLKPGEIVPLKIDMLATSNVFKAGHRLRVDISSSNYPRYERNANTEENPAFATHWVSATNRVYHDPSHSSAIVVSVVDQGSGRNQ
jgi:putative CocE/NonD family hydrolase